MLLTGMRAAHVDYPRMRMIFASNLNSIALCSRTGSDLIVSRVGTCGLGMPKRGHETAVHLRATEQRTHAKKTPCPSYLPALIFQPQPVSWGISSGKVPQVIRLFIYSCQITSANAIAPPPRCWRWTLFSTITWILKNHLPISHTLMSQWMSFWNFVSNSLHSIENI